MNKYIYFFLILFCNIFFIWFGYQLSNIIFHYSDFPIFSYSTLPTIILFLITFYLYKKVNHTKIFSVVLCLYTLLFSIYNLLLLYTFPVIVKELLIYEKIIYSVFNFLIFCLIIYWVFKRMDKKHILVIIIITIYNLFNVFCAWYSPNTVLTKFVYKLFD